MHYIDHKLQLRLL